VKCPECGGKMRRAERPGRGESMEPWEEVIKMNEATGIEGRDTMEPWEEIKRMNEMKTYTAYIPLPKDSARAEKLFALLKMNPPKEYKKAARIVIDLLFPDN